MTGEAGDGGPVQVFVDLTRFAATATRAQLRDRVRELEDVGATGVSVSDHIFFTSGGRPRTDGVGHGCDPLTTLAAVAGLSDRLAVQTVVVNSAWVHPGLLLRQFAQLAMLLSGDRVTAGLGAGWSTEEFDALGLAMPKFRTRIDRLAEVLAVARSLWTDGTVTYNGRHVVARDLPLSPVPDRPPRLLVGGGSDRLLGPAGRTPPSTVSPVASGWCVTPRRRPAPRDAVGVATQIWYAAFGSPAEVRAAEEELCERWAGIPYRPLHRSPYLLFGSPAQMAEALAERREAYGLQRISLSEESGIAAAPPDPVRFCREVLPLLD